MHLLLKIYTINPTLFFLLLLICYPYILSHFKCLFFFTLVYKRFSKSWAEVRQYTTLIKGL